jgi:hypothetical protein
MELLIDNKVWDVLCMESRLPLPQMGLQRQANVYWFLSPMGLKRWRLSF